MARRRELPPRRLRRLLAPLGGCVAALGPLQERVLVRRAGLRGFHGQSRGELAASLGTSRRRVARIERRALRNLQRLARAGACRRAPVTPAIAPPATVTVATAAAAGLPVTPDRSAVKHSFALGGGLRLGALLENGWKVTPQNAPAAIVLGAQARSYAGEHPIQFALAVLVTLLCGVLLVRELRRAV